MSSTVAVSIVRRQQVGTRRSCSARSRFCRDFLRIELSTVVVRVAPSGRLGPPRRGLVASGVPRSRAEGHAGLAPSARAARIGDRADDANRARAVEERVLGRRDCPAFG